MRFRVPQIALAVLLLSPPPAAAAPRTHVVVIDGMQFGPMPAVRAGDRITWLNRDLFRHTATSKDGRFNVDLMPGAKATVIVGKPGAFAVICRYHPGMRATLKVKP